MTTVMRLATVLVAVVTAFLPLKAAAVTVDSLFVTSPLKVLDILRKFSKNKFGNDKKMSSYS